MRVQLEHILTGGAGRALKIQGDAVVNRYTVNVEYGCMVSVAMSKR